MTVGIQSNPLVSTEPMKVANSLLEGPFRTPGNKCGLWAYQGVLYEWYGSKWERREMEWLEDLCWRELEDAFVETNVGGIPGMERYKPNRSKIDNVVRALLSKVRIKYSRIPLWLNDPSKECGSVVAFGDCLVDAKSLEVVQRTEDWFDPIVLPVDYEPEAECPRWLQCLEEWGRGDEVWNELLQRWMGYCLMNHRRHAKWLMMYGKVRSGKGTIGKVLQALLGGDGFLNSSLNDLSGEFGLDGLERSRVLCIGEVNELDNREGERATRVLKNVVGQDPLTINVKHRRQMRNVEVGAAPMMMANEIPRLPNKGRGLSSKMLVLPFDQSFEGHEDPYLIDKLLKELDGIAVWALQGAVNLEAGGGKFEMPERSADAIKMYHLQNNPFDHFLEERFNRSEGGFISTQLLLMQWADWVSRNEIKNLSIPRNQLTVRIETQSSWDVVRARPRGGARGLRGLSLKKRYEDLY